MYISEGEPMCCHQPTVSYNPDYKFFKFNDKNEDTREHEAHKGTSTSEDPLVCEMENKASRELVPCVLRNLVKDSEDLVEEKDRNGAQYPGHRNECRTRKRGKDVEFELPELVVFLQESCRHFFKEICIDKEIPSHANCSIENCELDHNNIYYMLCPDTECTENELAIQNSETFSSISYGSQPQSRVDDDIDIDPFTKQIVPESLLLVKEIQKAVLADSFVCCTHQEESQSREASKVSAEPENEDGILLECLRESSASFGQLVRSGGISFRSNSSAASSRSFAFPILAPEWEGSPVRMGKADIPPLRKHKSWRIRFICCKF